MEDSDQSSSSQNLIIIEEKNASADEAEQEENCEMKKNPMMLECDALNMGMMMMMSQLTVLQEWAVSCAYTLPPAGMSE